MRIIACALVLLCAVSFVRAEDKTYSVVKTFPIGGEGGWDLVTVDPQSHRLYVVRSSHTQVIDSESGKVAVVDTKAMKLLTKYPVAPDSSPVGMAIDREHRRLYIGCRKPQKMIVMDADTGKVLGDAPIGAGVDATQFDSGDSFASCRD